MSAARRWHAGMQAAAKQAGARQAGRQAAKHPPGGERHLEDAALLVPHRRRQAGRLPRDALLALGPAPAGLLPQLAQVGGTAAGGERAAAAAAAQSAQQRAPRGGGRAGHVRPGGAQQAGSCGAGQVRHQGEQPLGGGLLALIGSQRWPCAGGEEAQAGALGAPRQRRVQRGRRRAQADRVGAGACGAGSGQGRRHGRGGCAPCPGCERAWRAQRTTDMLAARHLPAHSHAGSAAAARPRKAPHLRPLAAGIWKRTAGGGAAPPPLRPRCPRRPPRRRRRVGRRPSAPRPTPPRLAAAPQHSQSRGSHPLTGHRGRCQTRSIAPPPTQRPCGAAAGAAAARPRRGSAAAQSRWTFQQGCTRLPVGGKRLANRGWVGGAGPGAGEHGQAQASTRKAGSGRAAASETWRSTGVERHTRRPAATAVAHCTDSMRLGPPTCTLCAARGKPRQRGQHLGRIHRAHKVDTGGCAAAAAAAGTGAAEKAAEHHQSLAKGHCQAVAAGREGQGRGHATGGLQARYEV